MCLRIVTYYAINPRYASTALTRTLPRRARARRASDRRISSRLRLRNARDCLTIAACKSHRVMRTRMDYPKISVRLCVRRQQTHFARLVHRWNALGGLSLRSVDTARRCESLENTPVSPGTFICISLCACVRTSREVRNRPWSVPRFIHASLGPREARPLARQARRIPYRSERVIEKG